MKAARRALRLIFGDSFGTPACQAKRFYGASLRGLVAVASIVGFSASAATVSWDGEGEPGLWSSTLNWSANILPAAADDLVFGPGVPSLIHLDGNRALAFNSLLFNGGGTLTLGAAGTTNQLTLGTATPNITVASGTTVNYNVLFTNGLNLSGGGTLILDNFFSTGGNLSVDGAGTTLQINPRIALAHTIGSLAGARSDWFVAGAPGAPTETITLTNGGTIRFVGSGTNPDGSTKQIVLGTGGGVIDVSNGYLNFDDGSQIIGTGQLIKRGAGRLTFASQDYALSGGSRVEQGFLEVRVNNGAGGTFAATAQHTLTGGLLGILSTTGTVANVFAHGGITLSGGTLAGNGLDAEFGSQSVNSVITFNSGNILAADYGNGTTARLPRINSYVQGTGTIQIIGGSGGNHRVVFQRASATETTFSGRYVLNDFTAIENNTRYSSNVGNAFGTATVEFKGVNTVLDIRDNGAGNNGTITGYGNNLEITGTVAGSIYSLAVRNNTANTGNAISLGSLTMGNHYLDINAQTGYQALFTGAQISGRSIIATRANTLANGGIAFSGNVVETVAGASFTKIGANTSATNTSQMNVLGKLQVSEVNVVQGTMALQGANGGVSVGAVSGTGILTVSTNGVLRLDDTTTVAAGQRIDAAVQVVMKGGQLTLQSNTAAALTSLQTITKFQVAEGYVTLDATRNNAGGLAVLQLGATGSLWSRASDTIVNFTGTSLGTAGLTSRIILAGQADSTFLGGWAVTGNEFAKYSNTVDNGHALGVTALAGTDYSLNSGVAGFVSGNHVKVTNNTALALGGSLVANSLNLQHATALAASTDSITTGGAANLLRIESGGIITATNYASIDNFALAANKGQVTAGVVTDTAATMYITNNAQFDIGARIVNNGTGALTLVKGGTGNLRLTNTSGTNNTFSGGLVILSGSVTVFNPAALSSDITLAGGMLDYNSSNANAAVNVGRNVIVTANGSTISLDNNTLNGATNANGSNTNQFINFGTLTFDAPFSGEAAPTLTFGGWDSMDANFTGMSLSNTPTIALMDRDANSILRISGVVSGTGGLVLTSVDVSTASAGPVYFGNNDAAANTYTGTITLRDGGGGAARLVLNKAKDVIAVTGDVVINGGGLYWGGRDKGNQLAATSKVYLFAGTLGQADEGTENGAPFDYDAIVPELIMKGGTFNAGRQSFVVNKAEVSGGTITVAGFLKDGATLTLNNAELLHGAPTINVQGDAVGDLTILRLGGSYFKTTGQNITLSNAAISSVLFAKGSEVWLETNVEIRPDVYAANSYSSGINVLAGRELQLINRLDLRGGTRGFDVAADTFYTIAANIINGGISKSGSGTLILGTYLNPSTFTGDINVQAGTLVARNNTSLGAGTSLVTVSAGATLELESGVRAQVGGLTLGGNGAADKDGALVSLRSGNKITGDATLTGNTTIAAAVVSLPYEAAFPLVTGPTNQFSRSELWLNGTVRGNGTLTLAGDGYGILGGLETTTGGLVKQGAGYWYLNGSSTYTGFTDITAGILNTSTTLGTAAAGTRVLGGATLQIRGGVNMAGESVELHGSGHFTQRGPLVSVSGNNTIGAVRLVTEAANPGITIHSISGNLAIAGGVISSTNANLILSGDGGGSITGGLATGTGTLTKVGSGRWELLGNTASTFTGTTTLSGGTLAVNTAASQFADSASLDFRGGDLVLLGSGTEVVNGMNLFAGGANISLGSATLSVGTLTRSTGASVNFSTGGGFVSTSSNTNGIIGGWATVGGADWASTNGSLISAFTGYVTHYEDTTTTATGDNLLVNTTQQVATGTALSVNSLKLEVGRGLALRNMNVTLAAGGVLYDGTAGSKFGVYSTGTLTSGTNEHVFHVDAGELDINMIIAGTSGLVKGGTGTLMLNVGNTFTGNVYINEGTLAILGQGGQTDSTALGTAGARSIVINGGTFSLLTGSYDPSATTKTFDIGTDGGTIHIGGGESTLVGAQSGGTQQYLQTGELRFNDASQISATGTLIKTGNGRLVLGNQTFAITGDIIVREGILSTQGEGSLGGRLPGQTITIEQGAMLQFGASNFDGTLNINGGHLMGRATTTFFNGLVNLSGNSSIYLINGEAFTTAVNMVFNNRIALDAGSTLNVYGRSNGNVMNFNGVNDINGTIRLNANTTIQAWNSGSLGDETNRATVELAGVNSRLYLHENTTSDFHANITATANSFLELRNSGAYTNHFFGVNNLTVASGTWLTLSGANGEQLNVNGTTTLGAGSLLNLSLNAVLHATAGGSDVKKLGTGTLYLLEGASWTGSYTQYAGGTYLRQGGTLENISSLIIKGGRLSIDNSEGLLASRVSDTATITMFGGELFSSGSETLGALLVKGSTDIRQSLASNTLEGTIGVQALSFAGTVQGSREVGGAIDFRSDGGGTLGVAGSTNSPRVQFRGETANIGFLGAGFNVGNDWAQYIFGAGDAHRGVLAMNTYSTNTAETGWLATMDLNIDNLSPTLTANRALRTLRFNTSTARTITLGTFNLVIDSGGILVTSTGGTHVIGANTSDAGTLTAKGDGTSNSELFIHTVGGGLTINAQIVNNGTGAVAVVKTQGNTLTLTNNNNSFTGGLYVNEGTVQAHVGTTGYTGAFGQAGSNIYLQGGTLAVRNDTIATTLNYDQNIVVRADSTLSVDRITTDSATIINNVVRFGKLSIDDATLFVRNNFNTTTAASNYNVLFNQGGRFDGVAVLDNARNGTTGNQVKVTIAGAIEGAGTLYKNNAGELEIGTSDLADTVANTWTGDFVINSGTVSLYKATGVQALGGNVFLNGGNLNVYSANQIADSSNLTINTGTLDFRGFSETLASITMNGGTFRTASTGTGGVVTVTGNATIKGTGSLTVDNGGSLSITGTLAISEMGRVETGATGLLEIGGLQLTGATLRAANGSGASNIVLKGNVQTFASEFSSVITGDNDTDAYLNLDNGVRTFNVADGTAADDLIVIARIRSTTAAGTGGGIIKEGAGTMVIGGVNATGTNTSNTFTGSVTVNQGRLDLRKTAGGAAISGDLLSIAAGAEVRQLNSNQIADATNLVVNGTYDLDYGNASDTVGAISGTNANAKILLGPGSTLTTSVATGNTSTYAGQILGTGAGTSTTTGALIKNGAGAWELTGNSEFAGNVIVSAGELSVSGQMRGHTVYAKTGTVLSGRGTTGNIVLESGSTLKPGGAADTANTTVGTLTVAGDVTTSNNSTLRFQVRSATTNTNFGGFAVDSTDYVNFLNTQAASNAAWNDMSAGSMDHLQIDGTLGNNGDFTLVSGAQVTVTGLDGYTGNFGDVFKLVDWSGVINATGWNAGGVIRGGTDIGDLDLISLSGNLVWDTRLFATQGILVVVPEPSRMVLLMLGLMALVCRRKRR